jgi:hypothetical protein
MAGKKKNAAEIKEPDANIVAWCGLRCWTFADGINASLVTLRSSGNGATSTAPTNCSVRLIHAMDSPLNAVRASRLQPGSGHLEPGRAT